MTSAKTALPPATGAIDAGGAAPAAPGLGSLAPITGILAAWRLLRPRHWVKNLFVFAALLFTPAAMSLANLRRAATVFAMFCLVSSAIYIVNDILDRDKDRLHPQKRFRPLAAGALPVAVAWLLFAAALAGASILGLFVAREVAWVLAVYGALNILYSLRLKQMAIIDVMTISVGFLMRIIAGAFAVAATASPWLLECVGLIALFLAIAKRRDDLVLKLPQAQRGSLAGYNTRYLDLCICLVLSCLLSVYMVYSATPEVIARLGTEKLYYTAPFVLGGIMRYLQLTIVEERSGSPTEILTADRFMLGCAGAWLVVFLLDVYGR